MEVDDLGPVLVLASHVADQLVILVPENRVELEEDLVEDAHPCFANGIAFALRQARVESDSSRSQHSKRYGNEHVAGLEATAVGEHVHVCARIVDLRDLVAEEDVGALGQPISNPGVALRKHPIVPRKAETL